MKHAGPTGLAALEPLLADIRALGLYSEPRPGVFYRRGRAALHFHEDPAGLFADCRAEDETDFTRVRVTTVAEQAALTARLRATPGGWNG